MRLKGGQLRFLLAAVLLLCAIGQVGTVSSLVRGWQWSIGPATSLLSAGDGGTGSAFRWPHAAPRPTFVAARFEPGLQRMEIPRARGKTERFEAYSIPDWGPEDRAPYLLRFLVGRANPGSPQAALRHATFAAPMRQASPAPFPTARPTSGATTSRWTGSAYLFLRQGSGRPALASNGQLGASQAAARIAYQLSDGPVRADVAARVYRPLGGKGGEAALGVDLYPLKSRSLRLSVERRAAIDGAGRDAWSAYAAGGLYAEPVRNVALDFYGQTGVVGVHSRDAFVDGAVRAGYRLGQATIGGGVWGAAQPGVARLDVGPRLALAMPVARGTLSLALEGRFRLAGRADPGSGVTLTLAADF